MPRSPVVFSLPPGTVPQVPDSVISSAMFNAAMSDIEQTFNTPQPIQYGGTNATTAAVARTNLGLSIGTDIPSYAQIGVKGYLSGLTLANNSTDAVNDIDISSGECASDAATPTIMALGATLTKRLDAAWAVGSGNGGLDTGSIANGTYHMWLIQRSDTGVVDALFSLSATTPTMPANYDRKRRIGSVIRVAGALIFFTQVGDYFHTQTVFEFTETNPGTAASLKTLIGVPSGIRVTAMLSGSALVSANSTNIAILYSPPDQADYTPATTGPFSYIAWDTSVVSGANVQAGVLTNLSGQIRSRFSVSPATLIHRMSSHGWIDTRGR